MKHCWCVAVDDLAMSDYEAAEFLRNRKVRIGFDVASWDTVYCIACGISISEKGLNEECLGDYG